MLHRRIPPANGGCFNRETNGQLITLYNESKTVNYFTRLQIGIH